MYRITFFPSLRTIVALLSYMDGAELPTISLETNSSLNSYFICSTKSPSKAYFFKMVCMPLREVLFFNSKFRIAKEPLGTGTRIAFDVSFPSNAGKAFATALPAPANYQKDTTDSSLDQNYALDS